MLLSDTREIKADPKTVWDAILNPDVLKECIPGCESLKPPPSCPAPPASHPQFGTSHGMCQG